MDQDYIAPGYVLTSSRKKVDVAAFEGIRSALYDRNFNSGHHVLGIEDEGMGISPMKYTKGMVPNEVIAELVFLQKLMKDGEVDIPQNEAELGSFDVNSINIPF
jgi:basic membrane protein A